MVFRRMYWNEKRLTMKFIRKNKVVIIFYLIIVISALAIIYDNKQYKKSISANSNLTDIQK